MVNGQWFVPLNLSQINLGLERGEKNRKKKGFTRGNWYTRL